ncbi:MAG: hypothetical protein E7568_00930 [Ruminococcaceae bacterium]|nr:hypothetical protein [Oscillospiraceae bacterium]
MPLSIFIDALPFNEITENYSQWFEDMQVSPLLPNIAYSSSLHWQLYCNKYPDERGVLVDWVKEPEKKLSIRVLSSILSPLDSMGNLGFLSRKVLNRIIYRKNVFANIPFKFRKYFSQKGTYLFWNKKTYEREEIFRDYVVVSQDEGHLSFETTIEKLKNSVEQKNKNIFAVFGFADALGHKCRRGEKYSQRLKPYMEVLTDVINCYRKLNPNEEILIVSDHGMSTVKVKVDLDLEQKFGKQSKKTYIAYCDTAVMCIFTENDKLKEEIESYLVTRNEGHLLDEKEREFFGTTDKKFGDIIYILKEGNVFTNNWFGKSIRKANPDGSGMHGFWPEEEAHDQMACIVLINGKSKLDRIYNYPSAHKIIKQVMSGV